ncbi:MAG: zinc metalloprotease HtpX [Desulfobacterales bacterium]|nr:zinc metalloprotease HtpX [Desulfobacterales bacterium]
MNNQIKTVILMSIMTIFIIIIGGLLGGQVGMIFAFIFACGMNFVSYWYSDKIVLKMYNAQLITPGQEPELYNSVEELTRRAGIPVPKIYIIPTEDLNAFATGRNPEHAVVAVTMGLLRNMNKEEVMGVLAHEIAHIKNRDILIGTIAASMAGAIMMIANMAKWSAIFGIGRNRDDEGGLGVFGTIVLSIIAPMAAVLIQMAISRSREYLADSTGASFMGSGESLAKALETLEHRPQRISMEVNPATAHMFIVNPLSGKNLMALFSTHPPIEDRIRRLRGGSPNDYGQRRNTWDNLS